MDFAALFPQGSVAPLEQLGDHQLEDVETWGKLGMGQNFAQESDRRFESTRILFWVHIEIVTRDPPTPVGCKGL